MKLEDIHVSFELNKFYEIYKTITSIKYYSNPEQYIFIKELETNINQLNLMLLGD